MSVKLFGWARGTKALHANKPAPVPQPAFPAETTGCFTGDAGSDRGRQDALPVAGILFRKEIPAGQAYHPGLDSFGSQCVRCCQTEFYFTARADEDAVGMATRGFLQHVASTGDACGWAQMRAIKSR